MSERQIKEYYERIEKLLNGANKETYGFAPQEIKNILRSYEELQKENKKYKEVIDKAIEYLEPFVEIDMCTIKGTMLKKPLEILKGEPNNE